MKNKIVAALLFFPAVVLGVYMLWLQGMTDFKRVEIAVSGYDPRDFFAGNYMNLQLDWDKTDCGQFENGVCPKEDFGEFYNFYIRQKNSYRLAYKVNAGSVKLVFSYEHGFEPMIVDLRVDGNSYINFVKENIK